MWAQGLGVVRAFRLIHLFRGYRAQGYRISGLELRVDVFGGPRVLAAGLGVSGCASENSKL